jgi:hypothetical protein
MLGRRRAATAVARSLCALALLVGLIGMHELASGLLDDCHTGPVVGMSAAMSTSDVPATVRQTRPAQFQAMPGGMANTCVSLAPGGWSPLQPALVGVLALAAALAMVARLRPGGSTERSPPSAGISLLRQVCVSRI